MSQEKGGRRGRLPLKEKEDGFPPTRNEAVDGPRLAIEIEDRFFTMGVRNSLRDSPSASKVPDLRI